jgi:hypothetical protein
MLNRPSHWIRGIEQDALDWLSGTAERHDRQIYRFEAQMYRGPTKNRSLRISGAVRRTSIWLIVAKLITPLRRTRFLLLSNSGSNSDFLIIDI